jgi:hypothetical protein
VISPSHQFGGAAGHEVPVSTEDARILPHRQGC